MAKKELTIADIQQMLAEKKEQLSALQAERKTLSDRLKDVEKQIATVSGGKRPGPKPKAKPNQAQNRSKGQARPQAREA